MFICKKIHLAGSFINRMLVILLLNVLSVKGFSQEPPWDFIKEREGIRIYTRSEETNPIKSFKGEAYFHTGMEAISRIIGRVDQFDWWDDNISEIKVLEYVEEKLIRYYLVYDVPWPLSDRDLCVEAIITHDPVTGKRVVYATPMSGLVPEHTDRVRITNYWQRWSMEPAGNGLVHLVLEGSVDPGGNIPSWLINMVITDTPLNIMRKVREQVEKN